MKSASTFGYPLSVLPAWAHLTGGQGVAGSNPVIPTNSKQNRTVTPPLLPVQTLNPARTNIGSTATFGYPVASRPSSLSPRGVA
jgi:hypothetical protein